MRIHSRARLCFASLLGAHTVHAADFHVDPANGAPGNDGSEASPWRTLEEVETAGHLGSRAAAGDTVFLHSGYHGDVAIDGGAYDPPLIIAAAPGAEARLRRLRVNGTTGLVVRGLSLSPSHAPTYERTTIVDVGDAASNVVIEDCHLFSESNVAAWGADEWVNRASSGVGVGGSDVIIRRNTLENVRFGISVDGVRALVSRNVIAGFSADGLRGLGDDGVFEYNVVKNAYADDSVDSNHDDGFQSWSVGPGGVGTGEVRGIVIRGNFFLNWEDPNQPLRATLQGIGCFDGTFVDWVIENNVVITDHWHGITLLGARNSRIVNNTVMDVNAERPGPPWISIDAHKDGTPPEGCLVRNNLTTDLSNAATGVVADANLIIDDPATLFVDPAGRDLRLLSTAAAAIDQGSADQAPATDAVGIPRPQGAGIDLGAYEWHEPGVSPVDGGAGTGGAGAGMGGAGAGMGGADAGMGGAGLGGAGVGTGGTGSSGGAASGGGGRPGNASGGTIAASTGGRSPGSSGAGGAPSGAPDGGGNAASNGTSSSDDGGCGCRIGARDDADSPVGAALLTMLSMTLLVRRKNQAS